MSSPRGLLSGEWRGLWPLIREELGSVFGRKFSTGDLGGVGENRVAMVSEVFDRGKGEFVRDDADMFEALAVRHDEVCYCDGCAERNSLVSEAVVFRLHDHARGVVTDNDASLFELNDTVEQFSSGTRPAVHQHGQFPGKRTVVRFGDSRFGAIATHRIRDLHFVIEKLAH